MDFFILSDLLLTTLKLNSCQLKRWKIAAFALVTFLCLTYCLEKLTNTNVPPLSFRNHRFLRPNFLPYKLWVVRATE